MNKYTLKSVIFLGALTVFGCVQALFLDSRLDRNDVSASSDKKITAARKAKYKNRVKNNNQKKVILFTGKTKSAGGLPGASKPGAG